MNTNPTSRYRLRLILLLLSAILQISCDCKNHEYIGKGEVTEEMVSEVEKAIEEYIKENTEVDSDSKTKFSLLLETLKKLQKGEKTNIPEDAKLAAMSLGQPDVLQAFINIVSRDTKNKALEKDLCRKLETAQFLKDMRERTAKIIKESREAAAKQILKEKQEKENRKKQKEENKRRHAKSIERILQEKIEFRLDAEQGGKGLWLRKTIFIPDCSIGSIEQIKEYMEYFKKLLTRESSSSGLSDNLQQKARVIIEHINKETNKLESTLESIQYVLSHPDYVLNHPSIKHYINYSEEDLQLISRFLEDLKNYKEEIGEILALHGENLADYEEESKEERDLETEEEKIAYRDLELAINDIADTQELVASSKQKMKALLATMRKDDAKRRELEQEASQLATQVAEVIEILEAKQIAINLLYFEADPNDYVNRPIDDGVQKYKLLDTAMGALNSTLNKFYIKFKIQEPRLKPVYTITKENLKKALTSLVDQLVPESELVKATLQSRPLPQTTEAWANLGIEVGFDFIPYGKELKLLVGPDKLDLQQKMKDLIILLLKKRASKGK